MNFKIVETSSEYPDVLVYLDKEETSEDDKIWVSIMAWGKPVGEDYDTQAYETVDFTSYETARSFIRDYSKESAEKWCKEQGIVY